MDKGVITFSFDDAREDTYKVFKNILEPMRIPAVVYVPSGFVETGYNNVLEIGYNGLMSKQELDYVNQCRLFEIGGHGYMHRNDFEDIELGVDKLKEWYPDIDSIGLASPHSKINKTFVMNNLSRYKKLGFSYVRGGRNFEKFTRIKRAVSLMARLTKSPVIFKWCYMHSVNKMPSNYYLNAIPIHKLTTLNQVLAIVDYCVKNKCWAILEFHGIDKKASKEYTEEFCWLEDDFISLCNYVKKLEKENLILIETPINIVLGEK